MLAQALSEVPTRDHRFTLQHCPLADAAQFRSMHALGMGVNLFANHHFYWGDQHYGTTVGPERAQRAAYTLKLDHQIGSIECGKRADFCVLEDDPTQVDPLALKDVQGWGTVQGGRVFAANQA